MQPAPTPSTSTPAPGPAPSTGAPHNPGPLGSMQPLVFLGLMFVVFYFLLIRPQQKRQREVDQMLKSLHKGDKVRTSGGIRGEILELTDTEATLLIADKVKVNVLRSHIASRIMPPDAKEKA